jgi:hypothetical protein
MTNTLFLDINRTIEWLAFNREVGPTGTVYDGTVIDGDYKAIQKVPAYASHMQAAQLIIKHFEKGGSLVTFTEDSDGWQCHFVPSSSDAG